MKTRKKRSVIWSMPSAQFAALVKKATSIGQILAHFGLKNKGGNHHTVRRRIAAESVDMSHIPVGRGSNKNRTFGPRQTLKELLVKNSTYQANHFKQRLVKEGLLPYMCADCGLKPYWNKKPLVLHIEHKNGDRHDNRLKNLCFLCPNCHSQTPTYAGRNSGTRIRT
ncbi:HNH endonuclease [bacterium]|nr:HNH endonuclease [bacterium]